MLECFAGKNFTIMFAELSKVGFPSQTNSVVIDTFMLTFTIYVLVKVNVHRYINWESLRGFAYIYIP